MNLINKKLLQAKYLIPATGIALVGGGIAANLLNKPSSYTPLSNEELDSQDIATKEALNRLKGQYPYMSIQYENNSPYLLNENPPLGQPKQKVWSYMDNAQ